MALAEDTLMPARGSKRAAPAYRSQPAGKARRLPPFWPSDDYEARMRRANVSPVERCRRSA